MVLEVVGRERERIDYILCGKGDNRGFRGGRRERERTDYWGDERDHHASCGMWPSSILHYAPITSHLVRSLEVIFSAYN